MILQQAIEHYGVEHQLNILTEELGELITDVSKWRNGRIPPEKVLGEIVDVEIMIQQLKIIISTKNPDLDINTIMTTIMEYKLERLKQRIEDDNTG